MTELVHCKLANCIWNLFAQDWEEACIQLPHALFSSEACKPGNKTSRISALGDKSYTGRF